MPPADSRIADSDAHRLAVLRELERKVLWLSTWTIHQANHLRPSRDGLKVGGHQASSASVCDAPDRAVSRRAAARRTASR